MKILITGSEGFIGKHLVNYLKDKHEILGLDRNNTPYSIELSDFEEIESQIYNFKPEVVVHLASNISDEFDECLEDIQSILNLLATCKEFNIKKFIFTSSAAVYGDSYPETKPISPYGISKLQCEQWCEYYKSLGLNITILRLGNVYGLNGKGVINKFMNNIKDNQALTIYGDGHQTRDFIYITDVIELIEKCIHEPNSSIFEIGTGIGSEIWDVVTALNRRPLTIFHHPHTKKEIRKSILDNAKAYLFLNHQKFIKIEEGIEKLWKLQK